MWSDEEGKKQQELERERQLIETDAFWGLMYKRGSRVFRYLNTRESALDLVGCILSLHNKITLEIQDEIVNQGHEIGETAAAHELNAEILRERANYLADLAAAKEYMKTAILEHDSQLQQIYKNQIDGLQDQIQRATDEQQKLTQTLEQVTRCKEEEFSAFREQIMREREQERERYDRERQEEIIRLRQHAEEERMRQQEASLEERQRAMDEQKRDHEAKIREIEERHRNFMNNLPRPSRSFWKRLDRFILG